MDADLKHGWDRSKYSLDDVRQLNQQCRGKEATLVKGLVFAGLTLFGMAGVLWAALRAARPKA